MYRGFTFSHVGYAARTIECRKVRTAYPTKLEHGIESHFGQ